MKKIFYFNPDTGGGIEDVGNIFLSFLNTIDNVEIVNYKHQNSPQRSADYLMKEKPDIVIINEKLINNMQASYYYKVFNPGTKLIFICHSRKSILPYKMVEERRGKIREQNLIELFFTSDYCNISDKIFILDTNKIEQVPEFIRDKTYCNYFPISKNDYKVTAEWQNRNKMFVYLGGLSPLKISPDFIEEIKKTNLSIDVYGYFYGSIEKSYIDLFTNCKNFKYYGQTKNVEKILNQYKFYVLPHNGTEIFNMSLCQSIMCGTIPLVCNDRTSNKFDFRWIDWASGLYFGCNKQTELIQNMINICKENPNYNEISRGISVEIENVIQFDIFKRYFIDYVKCLL